MGMEFIWIQVGQIDSDGICLDSRLRRLIMNSCGFKKKSVGVDSDGIFVAIIHLDGD